MMSQHVIALVSEDPGEHTEGLSRTRLALEGRGTDLHELLQKSKGQSSRFSIDNKGERSTLEARNSLLQGEQSARVRF